MDGSKFVPFGIQFSKRFELKFQILYFETLKADRLTTPFFLSQIPRFSQASGEVHFQNSRLRSELINFESTRHFQRSFCSF
mgnify:CR=1 FL=1